MSYKVELSAIDRGSAVSVAEQIADVFRRAISGGELAPGEKLPPTRALAEAAGVNHLTAARAYRVLAELGLVTSRVGAGTFVRGSAAAASGAAPAAGAGRRTSSAWQHYALPELEGAYVDSILVDLFAGGEARGDLIPLMTGYPSERSFPTEVLGRITDDVMSRCGPSAWQYAPADGAAPLREAIAEYVRGDGLDDGPDRVVVTTGARQALTLVARAVSRPGDVVACEAPSFAGVLRALRSAGPEVLSVPVDDDGLDVDALEQLLTRHEIRMLALQPRMQNPTGRDLSPERRERLAELAVRHGFFLVEDAIYAPLRFEGTDHGSLRPLAPDHVIYIHSLSKVVSPGLRAGWVIASGPVLDRIAQEKRTDDMTCATLPQLVAAEFLAGGHLEDQLPRTIELHREGRDAMLAAIDEHLDGIAELVHHPLGGGHVWVRTRDALDERLLYGEAVQQGVNFVPGGAAVSGRPDGTYMRLSFSFLEPDELREGVRRLGVAIRSLSRAERPLRSSLPLA
jgi:2-aminoadipate transaminase